MKFAVLAIPAGLALSACGGGSTSEYQALVNEAEALVTRLDGGLEPTLILPTGSASYDGIGIVTEDLDSTVAYIGDVALEVDFSGQTLLGTMGGFYRGETDSEGNPVGEGVPIDGDFIIASDTVASEFEMDVAGSLTMDGVNQDLDGTMTGAFGGANADLLLGAGMVGNVSTEATMVMIAER